MKRQSRYQILGLGLASLILGACTNVPTNEAPPAEEVATTPAPKPVKVAAQQTGGQCNGMMHSNNHLVNNDGKPSESVKIRVTGYGAPPKAFYPEPQRRLMSLRAAKIDAYRNLAERIKGVQIWGGTTIGDMVVEKDRFRVYLDTHLRGARVIAENPHDDGTYETIVELKVGQNFLMGAGLRNAENCNKQNEVPASERPIDGEQDAFVPVRMKRNIPVEPRPAFYFSEK